MFEKLLRICAVCSVLSVVLTGCVTSSMMATVCTRPPDGGGAVGGVYHLDSGGKSSLEKAVASALLNRRGLEPPVFVSQAREDALPLEITVVSETEGPLGFMGGVAYCNNFISFFSLGIWPWLYNHVTIRKICVHNECMSRTFEVETTNRAWSSFLVPFCLLPVPGWGEKRECSLDFNKSIASRAPSGFDEDIIAEAVAAHLFQADYESAVPRMIYTRPVKHLYDPKQNARHDAVLKQYSLLWCPSEWETIQRMRADLAVQDVMTSNLETRLIHLERNPKDSIPYLKACEKRYRMAKALETCYQRLERLAVGEER